jgi:mono/diheme cytochrome c family protein
MTVMSACAFRQKPSYNIPDDITGTQRTELLSSIDKGRRLYRLHCSQCHGIYGKGADNAPHFTDTQIDNYTAWAIRRDKANHAVAANMDTEQLHEVFLFLRSRRTTASGNEPPGKKG